MDNEELIQMYRQLCIERSELLLELAQYLPVKEDDIAIHQLALESYKVAPDENIVTRALIGAINQATQEVEEARKHIEEAKSAYEAFHHTSENPTSTANRNWRKKNK